VFGDSSSDHLDVLLGVEYIVKEKLLSVNDDALLPLTQHQSVRAGKLALHLCSVSLEGYMMIANQYIVGEQAAINLAEEQRRQEQAALQARRATQQAANTNSSHRTEASLRKGE